MYPHLIAAIRERLDVDSIVQVPGVGFRVYGLGFSLPSEHGSMDSTVVQVPGVGCRV